MLPLFLFVYTFGIINRLAGTVETTDIYEKEYIAPNERNSSFVKGPETRLSLAGVYGRRVQKRQRTKPATAAVRAAGAKQQISRLQALCVCRCNDFRLNRRNLQLAGQDGNQA